MMSKTWVMNSISVLMMGIVLVLTSGFAQAGNYNVKKMRYENLGGYVALAIAVWDEDQQDGTVKRCKLKNKYSIDKGRSVTINLGTPGDNWNKQQGGEDCKSGPSAGSEVWMEINIQTGDRLNCRKSGTTYVYSSSGGTVKYVTKGTTGNRNRCRNSSQ